MERKNNRTELGELYLEGAFEESRITEFGIHAAPGVHACAFV